MPPIEHSEKAREDGASLNGEYRPTSTGERGGQHRLPPAPYAKAATLATTYDFAVLKRETPHYTVLKGRIGQALADTRAAITRTTQGLAHSRQRLHELAEVLQPQRAQRDREAGGHLRLSHPQRSKSQAHKLLKIVPSSKPPIKNESE